MSAPGVVYADLELFLAGWLRARLAGRSEAYSAGVTVDNRFPETIPRRLIVLRDDSGPDTSIVTAERTVAVTVLAGTALLPKEAGDLARLTVALLKTVPSPDPANPVAAVTAARGPYRISEQSGRAAYYATITFSVVGTEL